MTCRWKRYRLRSSVQRLLFGLVVTLPRVGQPAPAKLTVSEVRAAAAVAAFDEGARLEAAGEKKAAAARYRSAAVTNRAALEALDTALPNYLARLRTLAGRTVTAYEGALRVSDEDWLREEAGEWCSRLFQRPDVSGEPTFAALQKKCAQWPASPPERPGREPPSLGPTEPVTPAGPEPSLDVRAPKSSTAETAMSGTHRSRGPRAETSSLSGDASPGEPDKDWRDLAIGGGVTLGLGAVSLALALVGVSGLVAADRQLGSHSCAVVGADQCGEFRERRHTYERMTLASAVTAGVLAGAGTALVTIAMRRRTAVLRAQKSKLSLTAVTHPAFFGLGLRGSF